MLICFLLYANNHKLFLAGTLAPLSAILKSHASLWPPFNERITLYTAVFMLSFFICTILLPFACVPVRSFTIAFSNFHLNARRQALAKSFLCSRSSIAPFS